MSSLKIDVDKLQYFLICECGYKTKALSPNVYKTLNLNPKTLKEITVRPKVKNGKLLFNRNNKEHRYIIEE